MARVTVEDCKKVVPNRFELVVLAGRRGRDISSGSPILVEKSNDKNAVIALREIAAKKLNIDLLRDNLMQDFRKNKPVEDSLDDNKKENYLELEETQGLDVSFDESFAEEMAIFAKEEMGDTAIEDDMSFEDEVLDAEDSKL